MIGDTLTQMLTDTGRYQLLPLTDALKQKIAASTSITGCNGCQIEWAREAGADLAVWGRTLARFARRAGQEGRQ